MTHQALNEISYAIIGAAYKVHSELGPGLLESAYEACMEYELISRGLSVERQKGLPLIYGDVQLDVGYRIDLIVNQDVIAEIKSVDSLAPIHQAQVMTYMKLTGIRLGLILNFNVKNLRNGGIKRVVL